MTPPIDLRIRLRVRRTGQVRSCRCRWRQPGLWLAEASAVPSPCVVQYRGAAGWTTYGRRLRTDDNWPL